MAHRPVAFRLIAVLVALAALPADAQTRISREEGRAFAAQLLTDGQPAAAAEVLRALIQADPEDVIALVLMSRSARAQGDGERARHFARRAWTAAETPEHRFAAAVVRAQAHATDTPGPLSVWWMRRALQIAPDEAARDFARTEAAALRRAAPLSVTLSFGLAPRSNINNGGANELYDLHPAVADLLRAYFGNPNLRPQGTLREGERPLSGLELNGGLTLRYRLSETRDSLTNLTFRVTGRTYRLSDEAKADSPGVSGSDFSDTVLSFGLSHRWVAESGTFGLDIEAGRIFYGGEPHSDIARATLGHSWALDEAVLTLDATLAGTRFADPEDDPSREIGLGLRYTRPVDLGRLDLGLTVTDVASDTPDRAYLGVGLEAGLRFLDGAADVTLGLEHRSYDETRYIAETREDWIGTLSASYAVTEWETFGFQPVLTLNARRLWSNAERPETRSLGAGLTFRSSF